MSAFHADDRGSNPLSSTSVLTKNIRVCAEYSRAYQSIDEAIGDALEVTPVTLREKESGMPRLHQPRKHFTAPTAPM